MTAPESLRLPHPVPAAIHGHRTVIAASLRDENGDNCQVVITRGPRGQCFYALNGAVEAISAERGREAAADLSGHRDATVHYVCGGLI